MSGDSLLKTAAIRYINARPLVYALEHNHVEHRFDLQLTSPSECSRLFREGAVKLALVPSIEYSNIRRAGQAWIVPGMAIGSRRVVNSVELFFNKGVSDLQTVATDTSSRTSVALLKIILREKYGVEPELVQMAPDIDAMLARADAALIIGDLALDLSTRLENRIDLVEEWNDLSGGLPFVFAFWIAAPDSLTSEDVPWLWRIPLPSRSGLSGPASTASWKPFSDSDEISMTLAILMSVLLPRSSLQQVLQSAVGEGATCVPAAVTALRCRRSPGGRVRSEPSPAGGKNYRHCANESTNPGRRYRRIPASPSW